MVGRGEVGLASLLDWGVDRRSFERAFLEKDAGRVEARRLQRADRGLGITLVLEQCEDCCLRHLKLETRGGTAVPPGGRRGTIGWTPAKALAARGQPRCGPCGPSSSPFGCPCAGPCAASPRTRGRAGTRLRRQGRLP